MAEEASLIKRFLGGDPKAGADALGELVAQGDAGEEALFARAIEFPKTVQVRRRWLQYVATRHETVADRLLARMREQTRFRDAHAAAYLFAGMRKEYSITDPLFRELDRAFKNVIDDPDSARELFVAWGHAGGDASSLWHFVKSSKYAWEKLLTFAFRAACTSFARMNSGDDWATEQLIKHEWSDFRLEEIANSPETLVHHGAVDSAEMWMQANDVFVCWRRGEVADVILREWSQHKHWRVRDFGAQILASLGFQRTLTPVSDWLAIEPLGTVRSSLLHALERTDTPAGADALLQHYESKDEGEPYVARVAWRANSKERALRVLRAIAGGQGSAAAEALVSLARAGEKHANLSSALDSQDPYRRLNAALASGYLGDLSQLERLASMLREAASAMERVYLSAALAMLGNSNGATALNDELIAAASASEFNKRLDVAFLHRYLQIAVVDAFTARDSEGWEYLNAWRPEMEPLEPVPTSIQAQAPAKQSEARSADTAKPSKPVSVVISTSKSAAPLKVFVSYSHRDERMRVKLGQHLASLVNDGLIHIWHDREIEAGVDWEGEINRELAEADIILLLVSASFLDSPYCRKELQKGLNQRSSGKSLPIPIILRPCDWKSVFNSKDYKTQALPRDDRSVADGTWPNHDAAYAIVAKELRTKFEKMKPVP